MWSPPNGIHRLTYFGIIFIGVILQIGKCQIVNRPPHFIPGSGDMSKFSLSENTPVGTPVYQLKGNDPEGSKLGYSISGPVFSVDRDTGVVKLRQELDRETQNLVEVIISITDEGILGTEPNTVSLRREIPIKDYNDNSPTFIGRPYTAKVVESTSVGNVIIVKPPILVTDRDEGINAEVQLSCFHDGNSENDICDTFHIRTERLSEGNYTGIVSLLKKLDFETKSSYILTVMAKDKALENPLASFATVAIEVIDVQDQPPIFMNIPYSATVEENTPEGTTILTVSAADGDIGNPRPLLLTLEDEIMGHFKLVPVGNPGDGKAALVTTNISLDRESPYILQNGGVYTFNVKATELINNELPADSSTTQVTIVVTDVDDHIPKFNQPSFNISVVENLQEGMPLPGLSVAVNDMDLGANSKYKLSLRNVQNSEGVFSVSPLQGEERTPLVVRVLNSTKLDYDVDDPSFRVFVFDLIASVNDTEVSKSRVTLNLQDANDNVPIFDKISYRFQVNENEKEGTKIGNITAYDRDSGIFGDIRYVLKGFGSDNFYTDIRKGGIYLQKSLDYEQQTSYSLTIVAIDGGDIETNANVFIDVIDLNDNYPIFESLEYMRTVREGATEFEPQFFVRATDNDGPSQGGGKITYKIESDNSISGNVFIIDADTGEIKLRRPAKSMDTEKGQYELIISATDHGTPPLKNTTRVLVRVGIPGNQRPIFKGHFRNFENLPVVGPPSYRVTIPENAPAGYNITTVSATDPDGLDSLLRYRIVGANDNFVINETTGLIKVAPQARLDRDLNSDNFEIIVNAVDAGTPIPETATTTVYVNIKDVNDKPPKFEQTNYIAYVSERTEPGVEVLKVTATDTDLNSELIYKIKKPVKATTKAGVNVSPGSFYKVDTIFRIDNSTGQIFVNGTLNHDLAAVIILTIEVRDVNAEVNIEQQFATTEVTIYVQSFKDTNPVFKNKGWKSSHPVVNISIKEEMPIGSVIFTLSAEDPLHNIPISSFNMVSSEGSEYFELNTNTGDITLKRRLDYESIEKNVFELQVRANSIDEQRTTITKVNITVENVNDNSPIFEQSEYKATLIENTKYPKRVLTVRATDKDAVLSANDEKIGYHKIIYSLHGENARMFEINNRTGDILVAQNQTIDRERNSQIKLIVKAEDSPGMPSESRQATANITIDILDVNDNVPEFVQKNYTTVIPENVSIDTLVLKVLANDPDEGPGGEVRYDFVNEGEVNGIFKINPVTGEIRTKQPLTGKGRSEPYEIIIRAQDNGGQVQKQESLYSDVSLLLYIGDVSENDGIPYFISPKIGQIANVSENATVGSAVFQVVANDPDNPLTPSGTLTYKIQEDTADSGSFRIDSETGLITTLLPLDRETKDTYRIILEVSDNGQPQQSVTRVLQINILDVDDHKPRFIREIDAQPVEMLVIEEEPIGSVVGNISAIDEDIGENGEIDYMFIDGNQEGIFSVQRTNDSYAIIKTHKRVDREEAESYLLTLKCFKFGLKSSDIPRDVYDPYDMSHIQILIKVKDIDDHLPEFEQKDPAIGVRINVPIETNIINVRAVDKDPEALPIAYTIENITFVPQFYRKQNQSLESFRSLFILNNSTGDIITGGNLANYVDGYFHLIVKANNSQKIKRYSVNNVKIFIIRDKSLLRFIFTRPATEVQAIIEDFQQKIHTKLKPMKLELHIFDTQVLSTSDYSLDFTATSSCFQLFKGGSALPLMEMQKIMNSKELKDKLLDVYAEYGVSQVDSCSVRRKLAAVNLITSAGTWLVILAALIGIAAICATCTAFCLAKKYKRISKRLQNSPRMSPTDPFRHGPPVLYSEPIYGPL